MRSLGLDPGLARGVAFMMVARARVTFCRYAVFSGGRCPLRGRRAKGPQLSGRSAPPLAPGGGGRRVGDAIISPDLLPLSIMDAVPAHRHCKVCGSTTPPEDPFCSPKCAQKRANQVRQQRLYTLLFAALTIFIIITLFRGY